MSCPAGVVPSKPTDGQWQRSFCVNRWQAVPVYSGLSSGMLSGEQIGTINFNDFFRFEWWWWVGVFGIPTAHCVLIRNSAGNLQWGYCGSEELTANSSRFFTPIENVFLFEQAWNNMTLRAYTIQNRPAQLRTLGGALIETLPVGSTVAIRAGIAASMGQTWCTFWQVTAVLRPVSQVLWEWQMADVVGNTWGFVDTGLPFNRPNTNTIRTSLA
ncbi:MAG: hypothetical protein Q8N36_02165 [bacterium]|nr:hypothetical protein [bacterium]